MFPWFCIFQKYEEVFWMIEVLHCSPFLKVLNGYNTIHYLTWLDREKVRYQDMLVLLLQPVYEFYKPLIFRAKFNLFEALTMEDS